MRSFFFLLVLLGSVSILHAQQDAFVADFLLRWENAKQYSLAVAEAMPESNYGFKPAETEMSYAEQLVHMGKNILMLSKNYLPAIEREEPSLQVAAASATKEEISRFLAACFDYGTASISSISAEQLNETVPFFAGPLSRRRVIMLLNDHQAHHRGQLIVYLRLNNIKPPAYLGW